MRKYVSPILAMLMLLAFSPSLAQSNQVKQKSKPVWTFTYLKATEGNKENLKSYLEKNWFAMDSIAVKRNLLGAYELIENTDTSSASSWDFIVAVEYLNPAGYSAIAKEFEAIRANHVEVTIDGFNLRQLGKIVKSETVLRKKYLNRN